MNLDIIRINCLFFLFFSTIALATTYKVNVITSKEFGSGTNANVYIVIFGKHNDTGLIKITSLVFIVFHNR